MTGSVTTLRPGAAEPIAVQRRRIEAEAEALRTAQVQALADQLAAARRLAQEVLELPLGHRPGVLQLARELVEGVPASLVRLCPNRS